MGRILRRSLILFVYMMGAQISAQQLLFGKQEAKLDYVPIKYTLKYEDIEGSPYVDKRLMNGCVKFLDGDSVLTYLRYNIFNDALEFLEGSTLLELKNLNKVDVIHTGTHDFVYKEYWLGPDRAKGYLVVASKGKYTLYIKHRVRFQKAVAARSSYHKDEPAKFVTMPLLFLLSVDGGPIVKTTFSKYELQELVGSRYDQVMEFRNKRKLRLSEEEDVKKLVEFLNTQVD